MVLRKNFKSFLLETLHPSSDNLSVNKKEIPEKWDVILFYGSYNPITKKELNNIKEFIKKFNIKEDVQIGLLTNEPSEPNSNYFIQKKINYDLTFEEKRYITTKFFGLKMFTFDLSGFIDLLNLKKIYEQKNKNIISQNYIKNKDNEQQEKELIKDINLKLQEYINKLLFIFKNNFYSNNILIVMPKENFIDINELMTITEFSSNKINLGFTFWGSNNIENDEESYKIFGNFLPISGEMIKAIVLLNYEKPKPENLRNFCHKYKISHLFNEIKNIHFKLNNDNYYLAFEYLFPDVSVQTYNKITNLEAKKSDLQFIMEMLKEMYIKDN